MYQSIDDDIEEQQDGGPDGLRADLLSRWPLLAGLAGIVAVVLGVWWTSPGRDAGPGDPVATAPAARAAYLRAIGEMDAPLRRARLSDFINQNPEDPRAPVARAQLDVLDAEEARAWQDVTTAAYDPVSPPEDRRLAVERYQAGWGRYLGGREAEVAELLAEIDGIETPEPRPDRALPRGPLPFDDTVPRDRLAGGPVTTPTPVAPIVIAPPPVRAPIAAPVVTAEIVPARVRRNVTPRYPRKAQRRNINAVVTLALDIDDRGRVATVEVLDVVADRYAKDFVKAAERAALRTRFHPKTIDGEPTESRAVQKRYRFESRR